MPINIYTCKPEEIRDPTELADILMRMDIDKKECAPDSADIGILKIQSRQLGPIYAIESREKAEKEIKKQFIITQEQPNGASSSILMRILKH